MKLHHGFHVPESCNTTQLKLAILNHHPRDDLIAFDEGPHKYYIRGESDYTSVTTVVHELFPEFDGKTVATNMVTRPDFFKSSKYKDYKHLQEYNTTDERVQEVLKMWELNRDIAAELGTRLHEACEYFYNDQPVPLTTPEYQYFLNYAETKKHWQPYRTEMMVFDEAYKVCGSVDMIYYDPVTKTYHLRDWKRSKKINKFAFGGKRGSNGLPDCNFFHYALQLNLYKWILEKNYSLPMEDMAIVVFHPSNDDFLEMEIPYLQHYIEDLLVRRTYKGVW